MRYNMALSLKEAFAGKKTSIKIPSSIACDSCKGSGGAGGPGGGGAGGNDGAGSQTFLWI